MNNPNLTQYQRHRINPIQGQPLSTTTDARMVELTRILSTAIAQELKQDEPKPVVHHHYHHGRDTGLRDAIIGLAIAFGFLLAGCFLVVTVHELTAHTESTSEVV